MPTYSGTSNTAQARAEEAAVAKKQGQATPVYSNTFQTSTPQPVSANDQRLQGLTDGGWSGSSNAQGQPVGDLAIYQANQKKNQVGIVDSVSAKTDVTKIQSDFQTMLSSLQNKQQYNQMGLNATNSVVDLMKSKGIADTSQEARKQLANQAGISDYNPANAESNKKLADAIMNSKAVGSAMNEMKPNTPEYDSALTKVTGAVSNTATTGNMQGTPAPKPAEPLTSMGTKVSEDPKTAEYDRVTKEIDDNNAGITASLNQLKTGAIPLTADQQAIVDQTQRSFDNAINQQKTANQAQENTARQAAFRSGSEYTPEVSSSIIKNVIDSNVLKIAEYDQKALLAVTKLKQDFKDSNFKAVKDSYELLQGTLKDKQKNMLDLMKLSHDYEKASLDHNLDTLKYKETVRSNKATEGISADKASRERGLTTAQINSTVNSIAGAFDNEQVVKNYNVVAEGAEFANSIANNTNPTSSDDQGLVYAFAKAMDPNSAVKEGEYITIQKYNQSLVERGWANAKRIASNTAFLTPEARKNMTDTINSKLQANKESYDNVATQYQRQIDDAYAGKPRTITNYSAGYKGGSNQQPILIDTNFTQNLINSGKSHAEIQQAVKDAKEYNASLSNVGGDTNQASVESLKNKVAKVETGGRDNPYTTRSDKPTKREGGRLDYAYGKYQVMGDNIPSWTKEALGKSMTIEEFKNSPEAQEKVATLKLGQYLKKHGNEKDAASVWFTGQPLAMGKNRKDSNGTTGQQYVNNVMRG